MPIYLEISPLHRLVTIVARGTVNGPEVRATAQKLADAKVRRFAKIVEIAGAAFDFAPDEIAGLAVLLRGADNDPRGPVAFVVGTRESPFAKGFAAHTAGEGPVDLFRTLQEARAWIARVPREVARPATPADTTPPDTTPPETTWADPDRHGTVIVGERQREYTTRELVG